MREMRFNWYPVFLLALVFGFSGCSGGEELPELHEVSGTATHNGQPLKGVNVTFTPADGGRSSSGKTDDNGNFTLLYNAKAEGVLEGNHKVSVSYVPTTPEEETQRMQPGYKPPAPYDVVVQKYGDAQTTPMQVEVTEDKEELELKFD